MPKNYYLYFHEGRVKRQSINLNDIYPESYALNRIPAGADVFAKIITSDVTNKRGYMVRFLKSTWLKCAMWTDFYPNDLTMEFKNAVLFHQAQKEYVNKYLPLLTDAERESLKTSTERTLNGLWE